MCSKFLCFPSRVLCARRLLYVPPAHCKKTRCILGLIPPSQYDVPLPKRFQLGYALRVYWEIIPVVGVTFFALTCMFGSIIWAALNKVDTVFTTHSRANISRTMDLRNPTCHKIVIINQRYEPWPEMADLLEKMKNAEIKALAQLENCPPC